MVYDPNSRRMVPAPVKETEYHMREAAEKQPRRRKSTKVQRAGSHLAKGTVGRPRGTLVEDGRKGREEPAEQSRVETAPAGEKSHIAREPQPKSTSTERREGKHAKIDVRGRSQSPETEASRLKSPPPPQPQHVIHEQAISPQLNETTNHQLPITTEESDEEDGGVLTTTPLSQKVLNALDSVPTRQKVFDEPRTAPTPIPEESDAPSESQPEPATQVLAESGPEPEPEPEAEAAAEPRRDNAVPIENKHVVGLSKSGSSHQNRSTSNSPVRQARFANSPSSSLSVRHHPLPRSASPIKPALKHSSAARDASVSDAGSDNVGSGDTSLASREEAPFPRKKSVRVSFDDQNTKVVGESAAVEEAESSTTPPNSQQVKRPWYSNIGRTKRREIALEDDEIMKPRPALPSFGSVRDKKTRQPEERPLVRPQDRSRSPSEPSSPVIPPQSSAPPGEISEPQPVSVDQSSDQALGAVLSQEQASRIPANISRFREPLPPVVTSAEGLQYMSDTTLDSDQESDGSGQGAEAAPRSRLPANHNSQANMRVEDKVLVNPPEAAKASPPQQSTTDEIPEISVIQPSPGFPPESLTFDTMKVPLAQPQYFDVPGGFPDDESGPSKPATETGDQADIAANAIFEPTAEVQPAQTESLPQTTLVTTAQPEVIPEPDTDSDAESIYSDAYEDLSDMEGGAFLSLNAVVESPVSKTAAQFPDKPAPRAQEPELEAEPAVATQIPPPGIPQPPRSLHDWEQAKSYWRSLTAEKREQLEREALEEAGMDGDREEVALPVRRHSSRRKTSEQKQAIANSKLQAAPEPKPAKIQPEEAHPTKPVSKPNHTSAAPTQTPHSMRSSMRDHPAAKNPQAQAPTSMRRSMRAGGGGQPTDSAPPRPTASGQDRPASLSSNAAGSALKQSKPPPLQRRGSDASDSSFKRSRPRSSGGMGFRKTMRQPDPQAPRAGSSRFSLRSLSPGGSPMRRTSIMSTDSAPPVSMMRRTLRSNSESSNEGRNSSHFPSFGRSSKATLSKKPKKASRFDDDDGSDEEVEPRPFHSRFDDDSDEDVPPSATDGRVLAKGTLRGSATAPAGFKKSMNVPEAVAESPELPDSDDHDDDAMTAMQTQHRAAASAALGGSSVRSLGTHTLTRAQSGRGGFSANLPSTTTAAATSPTKDGHRRGSFMSILRRNRKAAGGIQRSEPTESAARRDTKLERHPDQLRDLRAASPKLQKRNNSLRRGESWPLPEDAAAAAAAAAQRPGTSAGGGGVTRKTTGNGSVAAAAPSPRPSTSRRNTDLGLPASGARDHGDGDDDYSVSIASEARVHVKQQHKKKKFGALRRMFRLDD